MSQDIVADALNQIMNAKRAKKQEVKIVRSSKLLLNILDIMKKKAYIDYEASDNGVLIKILEVSQCKAIKPRYTVNKKTLDKYIRRFLPARNFGVVVVSTSKGLMTHEESKESQVGGSLIAYFY